MPKSRLRFLLSLISSLLVIGYWLLVIPAPAQEATDSAVSEATIKENIRERLEKVAKEATPAGSVLGQDTLKRAWVGILADIANHTLTIKTPADAKQAEVADQAVILGKGRQPLKLEGLEIGSFIIAMGYLGNNQVLDTRRVVVADQPQASPYQAYLVTLTSITSASLSVTDEESQSLTLATTKSTTITQTVSGKPTEIELSDLKPQDRLVVVAKTDPKAPSTLSTAAIHLSNSRTIPAQATDSTPSAKTQ